jgi:hypothetical protein
MTDTMRKAIEKTRDWLRKPPRALENMYRGRSRKSYADEAREIADAIDAHLSAQREGEAVAWQWLNGAPSKPWSGEWFLAELEWGDRVVLKELPEEHTYDFKTADETYIKREKIKRWAQIPDSEFITPPPPRAVTDEMAIEVLSRFHGVRLHPWSQHEVDRMRAAIEAALSGTKP